MLKSKNIVVQLGMITFHIRGLDIEVLLKVLSERRTTVLEKVWRCENQIGAIFVLEEVQWTGLEQDILIIVEHDVGTNTCKLSGIGWGRFGIGWQRLVPAEPTIQRFIEKLAQELGWHLELLPTEHVYKGSKCPSCGAVYIYRPEQMLSDGSVRCQNCDKPFIMTQK